MSVALDNMSNRRTLTEEEELWRSNVKRIYNERKKTLGLTQEKLAEECGWKSQGTIAQYFTGGRPLNTDAKIKLAWALKVPVTDIDPNMTATVNRDAPQTASDFMEIHKNDLAKMDPIDLIKLAGLIEGYVKAKTED